MSFQNTTNRLLEVQVVDVLSFNDYGVKRLLLLSLADIPPISTLRDRTVRIKCILPLLFLAFRSAPFWRKRCAASNFSILDCGADGRSAIVLLRSQIGASVRKDWYRLNCVVFD